MAEEVNPIDFECVDTGVPIDVISDKVLARREIMRKTINNLRSESLALRQEVAELKVHVNTMEQQNVMILKMINEQQQCLEGIFRIETREHCEYIDRFPIRSQKELDDIEREINNETRDSFIDTVRALLTPGGIMKRLSNVLSTDICLDYNLDGIISKKRLKDYTNLLDVIYRATMKDGWTERLFLLEMRQSLKLVKHRHHKTLCLMRKTVRANQEEPSSESTPTAATKPKPFTKIESS